MQEITIHRPSMPSVDDLIKIELTDLPEPENPRKSDDKDRVCNKYQVWVKSHGQWGKLARLDFLSKTPDERGEAGPDGLTFETLLGVMIHRLRGFQSGKYPCPENEAALKCLEVALQCFHFRTKDRIARNVEGERKP